MLCYLICLMHLLQSRALTNLNFFSENTYFSSCVRHSFWVTIYCEKHEQYQTFFILDWRIEWHIKRILKNYLKIQIKSARGLSPMQKMSTPSGHRWKSFFCCSCFSFKFPFGQFIYSLNCMSKKFWLFSYSINFSLLIWFKTFGHKFISILNSALSKTLDQLTTQSKPRSAQLPHIRT